MRVLWSLFYVFSHANQTDVIISLYHVVVDAHELKQTLNRISSSNSTVFNLSIGVLNKEAMVALKTTVNDEKGSPVITQSNKLR